MFLVHSDKDGCVKTLGSGVSSSDRSTGESSGKDIPLAPARAQTTWVLPYSLTPEKRKGNGSKMPHQIFVDDVRVVTVVHVLLCSSLL